MLIILVLQNTLIDRSYIVGTASSSIGIKISVTLLETFSKFD